MESPRRRNMQANRRRDTHPELALRRLLHAAGYRYRCDLRVVANSANARPDIVFTRAKVAVFVDGCFWHSCPKHGSTPKSNADYWGPKLARNRARDLADNQALEAAGWRVLRIWEHTAPEDALRAVLEAVPEPRHPRHADGSPLSAGSAKLG